MFVIDDGRESFYQWDLNQRLIVEDNTITEVHFCNKTDDCALVCEVFEEDGKRLVNVPNILLQTDWKIRVYGYCANHTKVEKCFKVNSRNKPSDYVYTETEILNYYTLAKNIDNLTMEMESINSTQEMQRIAFARVNERLDDIEQDVEVYGDSVTVLFQRVPNQQQIVSGIKDTGDYFNGKRVYSVFFNGGAFPNKSNKKITVQALANANADAIVSIVGCARNGSGRAVNIPFHSASGNFADIFAFSTGEVTIVSNYDANNALCASEFEIRFTKK